MPTKILSQVVDVPITEIPIKSIVGSEDERPLDLDQVKILAASIKRDRLRIPIDVVRKGKKHQRITGAHRVAACLSLGWTTIPARILDHAQSKAWAQGENLFRHLRELDRSLAMVKYVKAHNLHLPKGIRMGGPQPHDKGFNRISTSTGWDRNRVREAHLHYALSDQIQHLVREAKLDDNRAFLTKLAKLPTKSAQKELLTTQGDKKKTNAVRPRNTSRPPSGLSSVLKRHAIGEFKKRWARSGLDEYLRRFPAWRSEFLRNIDLAI